MTNLLDYKKNWDYTSEEELTQIYQEQYNDVFSKILLLNGNQFMNVLEKQIITYLYIIKKQPILSLLSRVSDYFIQKYYEDREKVYQAYQIIKETNINDLENLDKLNCYLHCPNTGDAFHTCGNKFILFNDYIFCLHCKKVYNEEQAKMFCDFCKMEYYTKLREIENEELENYFPVCYENPHCINEKEEKIKCKICKEYLYYDISSSNNNNNNNLNKNEKEKKKIDNLYCFKCKQNFKIKELDSKCVKCNKKFFSEIKIFNEFNHIKTDFLCLVHTLLKRKYAFPKNIKKRMCKCESLNPKKYKHNVDKGILLEGLRYGKKIIICNKCFKIFNYYNFNWNCPECGITINGNNNVFLSKELSDSSSVSYKIDQDKTSLKQNSKYNTAASGVKTKNIFSNTNNKSDNKNGKIIINNKERKNNVFNEINNSKMMINSQKAGNKYSEKQANAFINNNAYDKENKNNSNNIKDNNINNKNNHNINHNNRNNNVREKKIFNRININEENQFINANDNNNQTCNSLINSINSSIKLKNNFNDKNYNNSNNKTCIITFNENIVKEKNDGNILNNKSNLGRKLVNSKYFSPENKNDKIEYSLRQNNKDNKDMNNMKIKKERITSIENIKSENKLKKSHNFININEPKNVVSSKGSSKSKKNSTKNMENENNNNQINSNNQFNKTRKIYNRDQININGNNTNNNSNMIKIDLGKNDNVLSSAKSSINIHSVNSNLINNNMSNNKQNLRSKNDPNKNIKSPPKTTNPNNINNKKPYEFAKQEIIKRHYSSDKNKQNKDNNNIYINNKNKKKEIEENSSYKHTGNNKQIIKNNDNILSPMSEISSHEDNNKMNNNLSVIKKNQSVNLIVSKNNNPIIKRKMNKVKITDNNNEEKDKNKDLDEEKIIQRNRGSPNHKRVDIVHSKNNIQNAKNINVKLSHDLTNLNNNILNRSQNGKEPKDNKLSEIKPVNRSINIVNNINEHEKNNNDNQKKKIINSIYKSNKNSIAIIKQEENEDDNSCDFNVTKSVNYSGSKNKNKNESGKNSQKKNKLVENRYNNFNENNQIINENNIYIHDEKKDKE